MEEDVITDGEAKPRILPAEIVGLIVSNLEKADLLNSRLVCKSWNLECLRVLNNSKWILPLHQRNIKKYVRFLKSVQTPQLVLPLGLITDYGYDFKKELDFLIRVFGEQCVQTMSLPIWKRCHYSGYMAILGKVYKGLKEFDIEERDTGIAPERVRSLFNGVAFPNLTTFKVSTTQNTPTLSRTLLSTMSNIKAVDILDLNMEGVVDSLSNLESIENLKVWTFKPTLAFLHKIQEVKPRLREFNIFTLEIENDGEAMIFVDILNCLSLFPTLDRLTLAMRSRLNANFQFPIFPQLKHLKLRNEVPDHIEHINFNPQTFPVLESLEVYIDMLQAEEADDDDEYETEDDDEDDDGTEDDDKSEEDEKTEGEEVDPPAQTSRFSPLRSMISAVRRVARALTPCMGQEPNINNPDDMDTLDKSDDTVDKSDSLDTISLPGSAETQNFPRLKHLCVRSKAVVWTWNPSIFPALEILTLDFRFFFAKQTIQFPTLRVLRVVFDGVSIIHLPEIRLSDQILRGNLKKFHTMFPSLSKIIFENISDFSLGRREKVAPYFCTRFLEEFLLTVRGKNLKEIQILNDIDRDRNYLGDVIRLLENPPQLVLKNFEGNLPKPLEDIVTNAWDEYLGGLREAGVDVRSTTTSQSENNSILFERNNGNNRVISIFKDTQRIRMVLRSLTRGNPGFPVYDKHLTDFRLIAKYFPNLRELDIPAYWFESLKEDVRWELIQNIRSLFPGIILNRVEPLTKNVVTL